MPNIQDPAVVYKVKSIYPRYVTTGMSNPFNMYKDVFEASMVPDKTVKAASTKGNFYILFNHLSF